MILLRRPFDTSSSRLLPLLVASRRNSKCDWSMLWRFLERKLVGHLLVDAIFWPGSKVRFQLGLKLSRDMRWNIVETVVNVVEIGIVTGVLRLQKSRQKNNLSGRATGHGRKTLLVK